MKAYEWCVVGAGPAGIASIGNLLDSSVSPDGILWIDPSFTVGDFGTKWRFVSSNTTVGLFLRFYKHCKSFEYENRGYAIEELREDETCLLDLAAEPLRDITATLRKKIVHVQGEVKYIEQKNQRWQCHVISESESNGFFTANNVVLAIGSVPRSLSFSNGSSVIEEIPLAVALSPHLLSSSVESSDTIAVFGSSHSAIIILRTLLEQTKVKRVINVYREPLLYAVYLKDIILFDDTGLKGDTAKWSRENLHRQLDPRLERVLTDDAGVRNLITQCTKVIYAIGFERRKLTSGIEGLKLNLSYNSHTGIIAPGLFGCGIAFPEEKRDMYDNLEYRVGLWKFMQYLFTVIPLWMKYNVLEGIGQPKNAIEDESTNREMKARL